MLYRLIKKEVRELFNRSTLIAMIAMAFIFGMLGKTVSSAGEKMKEKPIITVVSYEKDEITEMMLVTLRARANVVFESDDEETARNALVNSDGTCMIIIEKGFADSILTGKQGVLTTEWRIKGAGFLNEVTTSGVSGIIGVLEREISEFLIDNKFDFESAFIFNPVKQVTNTSIRNNYYPGVHPRAVFDAISVKTAMIPTVIMMLIIMAGSTVISSMGLEKENKTLETLLTMPIKRSYIIMSKIIGSAVVGLAMGGIYIFGFSKYMNSMNSFSTQTVASLSPGPMEYVMIGLSIFAALLTGLSICMLLGVFAKDYKSSQMMVFPITAIAMVSMFLTMFLDVNTMSPVVKAVYMLLPFSHPMMAMRELMFGNYTIVIIGIIYNLILFAIVIAITVWIFSSDILLIGKIKMGRRKSA